MSFKPDWDSLKEHSRKFNEEYTPLWFHDSKLGVIIHWGPYSVPGWASLTGELGAVWETHGRRYWFFNNPYAEWYYNSMRIRGSPTWEYHIRTYGPEYSYSKFVEHLKEEVGKWRAEDWASLFSEVGIRYVVFVTKHHDGFLMWPSEYPNPKREGWHLDRDVVGELASAVRTKELKFVTYYSSGIDWTFNDTVIVDAETNEAAKPRDQEYRVYLLSHWEELVERYRPSILYSDIGYPFEEDLPGLFARYYNEVEEGLVNNRFTPRHYDFVTPEYRYSVREGVKWEVTRGLGYSYGYNRNETIEDCISLPSLIRLVVDVVSRNGNVQLGITPKANGEIPSHQVELLRGLGRWLKVNGEGIYGSRPFDTLTGASSSDGVPLRFTKGNGSLYVFSMLRPRAEKVRVPGICPSVGSKLELLGYGEVRDWGKEGDELWIRFPKDAGESPVYTFKLSPLPSPCV